uniref:Uncharacterized protein n=1 Tax=Cyanothece sp. (strain PCC 7425 / ATCC 29141) TaxID=395961 RepID=B8HKD3_CYAP4
MTTPSNANPQAAEPGRGAPGNQWGVQMAQNPAVNAPDERIPSNVDVEGNIQDIKAAEAEEADTDLKTTGGYVLRESGTLDNFAIEPQMYIEGEHGERIEVD